MLPFAAHPFAHCSTTRTRSRVGLGVRSKLPTPRKVPPKPASTSSRCVRGDDHLAWATRSGRPRTPTASGEICCGSERPGVAPVHVRHSACSSQNTLNLLRGVACHVRRALAFSKVRSEYSRLVKSGAYTQAAGLPAF